VIWRGAGGELNGCYPEAPDVSFEIVAADLWMNNRAE